MASGVPMRLSGAWADAIEDELNAWTEQTKEAMEEEGGRDTKRMRICGLFASQRALAHHGFGLEEGFNVLTAVAFKEDEAPANYFAVDRADIAHACACACVQVFRC